MTQKIKVYCKNCEYCGFDSEFCKIKNEYTNQEYRGAELKNAKNRDGDCKDYKKKWYLFWKQ